LKQGTWVCQGYIINYNIYEFWNLPTYNKKNKSFKDLNTKIHFEISNLISSGNGNLHIEMKTITPFKKKTKVDYKINISV